MNVIKNRDLEKKKETLEKNFTERESNSIVMAMASIAQSQ